MSQEVFENYTKYAYAPLREFGLPEDQAKFLAEVGLPMWCAPNMHFGELGEDWRQLPIIEVGAGYIGLGEDKNDNPIALLKNKHSVWVLSGSNTPAYMANNVLELYEVLYRFQSCVDSALELNVQAYTGGHIPRHILELFVGWAKKKNALLVQEGSFWHGQLQDFGYA